jgi:hypothetical protein
MHFRAGLADFSVSRFFLLETRPAEKMLKEKTGTHGIWFGYVQNFCQHLRTASKAMR